MALTEIPIELSSTPGIVDNSTSTAITIDSSGNVGIGTSSPDSILHLSDTGESRITFEGPAWGNYIGVTAYDNVVIAADENQGSATSSIRFRVDAEERMRINSIGNVGIGVTPASDWNTGYTALQIGQGAAIMSSDDTEELFLNMNAKWASDSSWEYIADGAAAVLSMDQATPFKFRYVASGTANTDISFSEAMRIDSSGRLLINKTSSTGSLSLESQAPSGFSVGSGFYSAVTQSTIEFKDTNTTANYKVRIGSETDDLLMFAGGSERMRIDASGNVGINATTISANGLQIGNTSSTDTEQLFLYSNKAVFSISTDGATNAAGTTIAYSWANGGQGPLKFDNATSTVMTLDASGNVGIGTSSPSSYHAPADNLVIGSSGDNGLTIASGTSSGGTICFADGTSGGAQYAGFIDYQHNGDYMRFGTNAGAEAMRIDASGKVGLNVSTITDHLEINGGASYPHIRLRSSVNTSRYMRMGMTDATTSTIEANGTSTVINFKTAGAERMRIDASGNLLVNRTSVFTTAKMEIQSDAGDASTLALNSIDTDGSILEFYKAGTLVGSIGSATGPVLYTVFNDAISDNVAALKGASGAILPSTNTGADKDGTMSLGDTGARFADLYLSGGVVFGTTGGAVTSKTLDDYEEGTWTPTIYGAGTAGTYTYSNGFATYTKVGRRVTIGMYITGITEVSAGSDYLVIGGVPFAKIANSQFTGAIRTEQVNLGTSNTSAIVEFTTASSSSSALYIRGIQNNAGGSDVQISGLTSGSSIIGFSITYFTT